jgi:hypothetical protein
MRAPTSVSEGRGRSSARTRGARSSSTWAAAAAAESERVDVDSGIHIVRADRGAVRVQHTRSVHGPGATARSRGVNMLLRLFVP